MTLGKPIFSVSLTFSNCKMERMLLVSGVTFRMVWSEFHIP